MDRRSPSIRDLSGGGAGLVIRPAPLVSASLIGIEALGHRMGDLPDSGRAYLHPLVMQRTAAEIDQVGRYLVEAQEPAAVRRGKAVCIGFA